MPRLDIEALLFCAAWAALALYAGLVSGWPAGAVITVGLMLLVMPTSAVAIARFDSRAVERAARWILLLLVSGVYLAWRSRG